MNKVKLAIVGLGGIAQVIHMPILSKMEEVDIIAVCDVMFYSPIDRGGGCLHVLRQVKLSVFNPQLINS